LDLDRALICRPFRPRNPKPVNSVKSVADFFQCYGRAYVSAGPSDLANSLDLDLVLELDLDLDRALICRPFRPRNPKPVNSVKSVADFFQCYDRASSLVTDYAPPAFETFPR
jgi:hypothetical protein